MEVMFLRRVSSIAQSAAAESDDEGDGEELGGLIVLSAEGAVAMQYGEALLTQKTSRQQAVTPRLGGRLVKDVGRV